MWEDVWFMEWIQDCWLLVYEEETVEFFFRFFLRGMAASPAPHCRGANLRFAWENALHSPHAPG
jgi:hypothetical protein